MCAECGNLHRFFVLAQGRHTEALAAAFYRVSTKIAAIREVDMERAASDLYEHQLACPLALEQRLMELQSAHILSQLSECASHAKTTGQGERRPV